MTVGRQRSRLAGGVVIAALLLAGCSSDSDDGGSPSVSDAGGSSIEWKDCDSGFQCGRLDVPLDHTQPTGEKIKIAVIRKQAKGRGGRIGSLVINPGGPGGSGVDYAKYAALTFPNELRDRYDIVGFDPRGVGNSSAIRCLEGPEMDSFTQLDTTPDTPEEEQAAAEGSARYGEACAKNSGPLIGHVGTVDAAKDMDLLRAALGDDKLFYLGASYGTFLGATYAELFPQRVGRLVLDGAVDPAEPAATANRIQAGGFETALTAYLDDCVAKGGCFLGADRETARARVGTFLRQLDGAPLPGDAKRQLTESLGTTGVISALYAEEQWPLLSTALQAAFKGNGKPLLALSDRYYEREAGGDYTNLMAANAAVNCLDGPPAATTADQVKAGVPAFEQSSPTFGRNLAWSGLTCAAWPAKPTGQPHRITAPGAAPILVVGTLRDPATPYAWAQSLASQLTSGHLLTYDGDGHTAFGRGSSCVDAAVVAYLTDGKIPDQGKTCR